MMNRGACPTHSIEYNAAETEGGKCPLCLSNNDFDRKNFSKIRRSIKLFKLTEPDIPDIPDFIPDTTKHSCQYCGRPVERQYGLTMNFTCYYCRRKKLREKARELKRKPFPKFIRNKNI